MSDWRETLKRAAALSSDAAQALPSLTRLLESIERGDATVEHVVAELGTIAAPRPGFVEALDRALRSGRRDQPGLAAARAVLLELPPLLDRVVATPPAGPAPLGELGANATLARMHAHEREGSERGAHPSLVCPRCGSRKIETRHTDAFERREIEVMCSDCGNYGAWTEGDAEESAWH